MSRFDERWSDIDPILSAALELPAGERAAYVARACASDAELQALVEALLAQSTHGAPAAVDGPLWDTLASDVTEVGAIDRYRLVEEIGRGGMSIVYKAERTDGAFDAPVALKLATIGALDVAGRARFERERRLLAELRHPNIAHILDGGETSLGQPYLVMELVDGEPIDVYADRQKLTIDARLALFTDVARAVQHAHRNLIVHRDIKPSNVLVDREGRAKLLDFGIAALVDDPDGTVTHTHIRPMTPAFASPEQLRGETVTTVSDVYQLGHLLYRLLTGCPPYRADTHDTDSWRRAITETDPARPSDVVARDAVRERLAPEGAGVADIARDRGTTPSKLARALRGDLETIVLKSLRKEPDRRYDSALQLAEDIERFREGLPVRAQPDTAGYRLRKFVARNRTAVGASLLLALLLVAFAVTVTIQAGRISRERDRAQREAATAAGVTNFLLDIFEESAPVQGSTVDVRALDVVDRAAERIDVDLTDEPIVRARVMAAIGGLFNRFGVEARGRPLLSEAVSVLEQDKAQNPLPWAFAVSELATLEVSDGYTQEEVDDLKEVVDIYRAEFGEGTLPVIGTKLALGNAMLWTGDFAGSRAVHDDAMTEFEAIDPESDPDWLTMVGGIVSIMGARGNVDRALHLLEVAYPIAKEADHTPILYTLSGQLAELYGARDDVDRLSRFAKEHLEYGRRTFGEGNSALTSAWRLMGRAEHAKGRYGAAGDAYARMKEIERPDAAMGQNVANSLSPVELLIDDGRAAEALPGIQASVESLASLFGYDTSLTCQARLLRARAWLDVGNVAAADSALRSLDAFHLRTGRGPRGHAEALETLGRLHLEEGRPDSAVATLKRASEAISHLSPDFWKVARINGTYGRAHLAAGDAEAARPLLIEAKRVLDGRGDRYEREVDAALGSLPRD